MGLGGKNYLDLALCKMKKQWQEFIDYIITGDCGCHKVVRLIYKIPCWDDEACPSGNKLGMFFNESPDWGPASGNCSIKTETEDIKLPVLFETDKRRIRTSNDGFYDTLVQIICTEENKEKLMQASEVIIDVDNQICSNQSYVKVGHPESCGWSPECQYYILWFKVCKV